MLKPLLIVLCFVCYSVGQAQISLAQTYWHESKKQDHSIQLDMKADSTFEQDDRSNDLGRKHFYGYWRVRKNEIVLTYYNKIGPFADSVNKRILLYKKDDSSDYYKLYEKQSLLQSVNYSLNHKAKQKRYYKRIQLDMANANVGFSDGGIYYVKDSSPPWQAKVIVDGYLRIMAKIYGTDTVHVWAVDTITDTQASLRKYIEEHINYPEVEKEAQITGHVYASFIVEKDGSVTNVKILHAVAGGLGLGKEVLRVLSVIPKVPPHMHKGKPVKVMYCVVMRFMLT